MARKLLSSSRLLLAQTWPKLSISSNWIVGLDKSTTAQTRHLQTTSSRWSLEEFFDNPKYYGEMKVKSGRPWRTDELRLKSNSDLHKLWFVLYKERNMLYTMREAAKQESEIFPSPERIDKVEEGMANLENVVRERNQAYWDLEVSPCATGERPSVFRRDVFGRPRWLKTSQHIVPYSRNWAFRNSQGPGNHNETESFFQHYREMKRKHYNYKRSRTSLHIRNIFRRFPDADVDYIAESHPELPPGYVQHLKENIHLYDDRPPRMAERSVNASGRAMLNSKQEKLLE